MKPDIANVLTVNRVGFLGGVERVLVGCGRAGQLQGFHAIIACPMPGELAAEAARQGLETVPLGIDRSKATASPLGWARLLRALLRGRRQVGHLVRRRGVRILHVHHPIGALYALSAARIPGVQLLLHVHETLPAHRLYRAVARLVMPRCAAIACVCERSRELALALGAEPARVRVIYNGVDPGFLAAPAPVDALAGAGPHVGLFGVLEPRKGQDVFIEAAIRVARQVPAAQFWIVGNLSFAENAPYVASLRSAIDAAGLRGRIHLPGHQRNVRDWMARMDAVVLASRDREALPTVLIEAALLGRPLVATDVGGVREIITDAHSGLVVPPGDAAALAAAILRALGEEAAAFGAAARAAAQSGFSFERFADDMAALYHALLAEAEPDGSDPPAPVLVPAGSASGMRVA